MRRKHSRMMAIILSTIILAGCSNSSHLSVSQTHSSPSATAQPRPTAEPLAVSVSPERSCYQQLYDQPDNPNWALYAEITITNYAKQLKIPSFAEYQEVLRQADPSAGFSDLLLELMKAETASRQENQNRRRLKAAGFPYLKTMEEFDYSQLNDAVSPLFLQELASCQFIQNRQNVIMIGNPGRGKTHLAIALGLKACTQGYNVLFKNAATLSTELCEAKDNYHLGKLERTLAKADLLILDELSYLSFNRHQSELLFKVISDRSEKSSTIVTTNLPFSKWTDLFENTTMVTALIDRLTFRSHVLDMNGDSYRLKATMQNKA